jgi:hypothetical protein
MVDAGLLIASMFVAPGASAVNEANTIAAVGWCWKRSWLVLTSC